MQKMAIRTRKIKSAARKAVKKKRRAVLRKAVAAKKLQTAATGAEAAPKVVSPIFTTE